MAQVVRQKSGSLAEDMRMLLETGDNADVMLQTADSCLPVHRAVLSARSPVFAAMFRYDTKESQEACVGIEDVDEEVLRKLLYFIYTDEVPPLDVVAADLLVAADKYQLKSLKSGCEEQLVNNLNIENAAAVAVLAISHSCDQLTTSVIKFMKTHYLQIIGTKGWEEALHNNVDTSVEICKLISKEGTKQSRANKICVASVSKQMQEESSLACDLGKLLKSGQGADITLVVSGSELRAHRSILSARSLVFAAMLERVSDGSLDIRGDTPDVLQQIVYFMYTDKVPCLESMAGQLFSAAFKYDLPVLITLCEEQLSKGLTIENASAVASIVLTHVCPCLRKTVLKFIKDNFMKVIGTIGWACLLWDNAGAAVTICQFVADPSVEKRCEICSA